MMIFEFHLPFWAILYCGLILANGILTLFLNPDKTPLYIIAQLLSTLFTISFFFFYYEALDRPDNIMTLLLMLFFILYQEIWANKTLYQKMIFENIPSSERIFTLTLIIITMALFLLPFLFIVISLIKNYF